MTLTLTGISLEYRLGTWMDTVPLELRSTLMSLLFTLSGVFKVHCRL